MSALVKQGLDIVVRVRGVHEDEGPPAEFETGAVAARGFPFATLQIEQSLPVHRFEVIAENRIDLAKHSRGAGDQLVGGFIRSQTGSALGIGFGIPRADAPDAKFLRLASV